MNSQCLRPRDRLDLALRRKQVFGGVRGDFLATGCFNPIVRPQAAASYCLTVKGFAADNPGTKFLLCVPYRATQEVLTSPASGLTLLEIVPLTFTDLFI